MSHLANLLAWIAGAIVSCVAYWGVAVYLLGEFDHGYGQLAYFQLGLYLAMISMVAGLVGYAALTSIRRRARSPVGALLAGVAFTVCARAVVFAPGSMYPDRDMTVQGMAGALMIGALTAFVPFPKVT